jgi:hypothetical protein
MLTTYTSYIPVYQHKKPNTNITVLWDGILTCSSSSGLQSPEDTIRPRMQHWTFGGRYRRSYIYVTSSRMCAFHMDCCGLRTPLDFVPPNLLGTNTYMRVKYFMLLHLIHISNGSRHNKLSFKTKTCQ